ncbi:MAG: 16S rRNA (cytidine(1402)-2'-O)-methyltransferase [Acidiferrobacteraceae bacterium]
MTNVTPGTLYVVATPIGNLGDLSPRAARTLAEVALIACEDTRHTAQLMTHFGIHTPLFSLHDFNEQEAVTALLSQLASGRSIALVSDAGTPLVSDPGFRLVRATHERGMPVCSVPGPSAVIAALSVAGMPTDRFSFEGFPPARRAARRAWLESLITEARTMIFFEAPHRVETCVADMVTVFGPARAAAIARELTKRFETVYNAPLGEIAQWLHDHPQQRQGEFVLLIKGADEEATAADREREARRVLTLLLQNLPVARAVALACDITGQNRNFLYRCALEQAD